MRYIGPYAANAIPALVDLVEASTEARKLLIKPLLPSIFTACSNYVANEPNVHVLQPLSWSVGEKNALVDLYEGKTKAVEKALGEMRDSLSAANSDLCPFCSLDTNPDLDHFLPKRVFPEFSLFARNLLPICTCCNRKKGNRYKDASGRAFAFALHETWLDSPFLEADLSTTGTLHASYRIDGASVFSADQRALADRHFRRLGLQRRYSKRANAHLAALKLSLRRASPQVRHRHIVSHAQTSSNASPQNGWEPVLYRALVFRLQDVLVWLAKS